MTTQLQALHAQVKAELEAKAALRPLARESALKAARVAEDEFITARLKAWADVLKSN